MLRKLDKAIPAELETIALKSVGQRTGRSLLHRAGIGRRPAPFPGGPAHHRAAAGPVSAPGEMGPAPPRCGRRHGRLFVRRHRRAGDRHRRHLAEAARDDHRL